MERKNVSAEDVAKRAGVSRTTVSFVFNNTPGKRISEATRQKVFKAAEELNYTPNEYARGLALTRHMTVGLLVCHTHSALSDTYIVRLIDGMSQVLNRYRFRLAIVPVGLDETDYLSVAKQNGVDGVVVINTHEHDQYLKSMIEAEFPFVVIGSAEFEDIYRVDVNNRAAAKKGVEYLIGLGHRRIAMITQALRAYHATEERIAGYRDALLEAGIPVREEWIEYGDFTEQSGFEAMKRLLSLDVPPEAVFAARDSVAYGAILAIRAAGLSVPDDISIIGYDDDFVSRYLSPPLSCVALPAASIGAEAAELIVKRLSGAAMPKNKKVTLPTRLLKRGSCKKSDLLAAVEGPEFGK